MNRILFKPGEVSDNGCAVLTDERAEHIRHVLQPAPGDTVRVGLVNGPCGVGEVVSVDDTSVELTCRFDVAPPLVPPIDLLLAMPRPKVMKRLWAPLASLGLGRIIITNAARVERNYFDTHWLDPVRYTPFLIEGLQQAGATRLPEVTVTRRFRPLIEDDLDALAPGSKRVVAHPHHAAPPDQAFAVAADQRLLLAVGPEGGWVPFELELLKAAGFTAVALPYGTLRTDVACIALLTAAGLYR